LLRVGHKNFAIEISDAERAVHSGKVRVNEPVGVRLMKILIESIDFPPVKVCCVEKIVTVGDAQGCAFVNGNARDVRLGAVSIIDTIAALFDPQLSKNRFRPDPTEESCKCSRYLKNKYKVRHGCPPKS
jgi:hypothetical protein